MTVGILLWMVHVQMVQVSCFPVVEEMGMDRGHMQPNSFLSVISVGTMHNIEQILYNCNRKIHRPKCTEGSHSLTRTTLAFDL